MGCSFFSATAALEPHKAKDSLGPSVFYQWLSKLLANERRGNICHVFSHLPRPWWKLVKSLLGHRWKPPELLGTSTETKTFHTIRQLHHSVGVDWKQKYFFRLVYQTRNLSYIKRNHLNLLLRQRLSSFVNLQRAFCMISQHRKPQLNLSVISRRKICRY